MKDVKDAAQEYIDKGWQVVPLAKGTKACVDANWTNLIFQPEDFRAGDNLGIRSVNGLVDIDCDAAEVVALAKYFLPSTGATYGRQSKPASHWLYKSDFDKIIVYKDQGAEADKATLIEIRVKHQSMAPPSVHPNGEAIQWVGELGGAPDVDPTVLLRRVRLLATASLLVRYYNPPGNRHDWGIAIAGLFRGLGITEEEAFLVVDKTAEHVGDDDKKDRLTSVRSTYSRPDDEPIAGAKALKDLLSHPERFLGSIRKIWGTSGGAFIVDDKDRIIADNQENLRRAFKKLEVVLTYDKFIHKPIVDYDGKAQVVNDEVRNRIWLTIDERLHFRPSQVFFDIVVSDTAHQNSFHPVQDYFDSLKWDKKQRLNDWLITYAGAKPHGITAEARSAQLRYIRAVSALPILAAAKRIQSPGAKFDELLVLESGQGLLKSSALRTLCPKDEWFSDDLPLNVSAKEIIERTAGKLVIEAPELSGMRSAQVEHLKATGSRQVDGPVRMAYARHPIEVPRQFVIIGTTNAQKYLRDSTGGRRFWPVRVERFDLSGLREARDQIWAEAIHRVSQGESIRLDTELYAVAKTYQNARRIEDTWEEPIGLVSPIDKKVRHSRSELFELLDIPIDRQDAKANERIVQVMQRLGFRSMTMRRGTKVVRGWGREPLENHALLRKALTDDERIAEEETRKAMEDVTEDHEDA